MFSHTTDNSNPYPTSLRTTYESIPYTHPEPKFFSGINYKHIHSERKVNQLICGVSNEFEDMNIYILLYVLCTIMWLY